MSVFHVQKVMNETLKPCPFCGGEVKLTEEQTIGCFRIQCTKCPVDLGRYWYFSANDVINAWNRRADNEEYEHLLKIARKMHTWIFLNTGDEQAVYDEIGLSDEDNVLLGYGGQIELTAGEKEG